MFNVGKTRAFGETPRRAGRRMGARDETVPAPQIAFGGDKPLAGLQAAHQFCAPLAADDADLRETPRQFRRRVDVGRERLDAVRQRRIVRHHAEVRPAQRRGGIGWRVEIVAERCTERLLVALGDADAVDDRWPQVLGLAGDELGDGLGFGLKTLHALVGFHHGCARAIELGARRDLRGFARLHRAGRLREGFLCGAHRLRKRFEIGETAGLGVELLDIAVDAGDFLIDARKAFRVGADIVFELAAARGEIGQRGGEFGEGALGSGQRFIGFRHLGVCAAALLDARLDFFLEDCFLGIEPLHGDVGVRQLALFALDVGGKLRQAAV
ncbi:hypothetical protein BN961_02347 [Afipia felis]|uniref:Uncharacterized protein n=1 Tax=Afipia felis TaxID=1035 RepID=A0A090MRV8_AFIFE|nr:hypothetical protein BN961_02347 [Afipia felis]